MHWYHYQQLALTFQFLYKVLKDLGLGKLIVDPTSPFLCSLFLNITITFYSELEKICAINQIHSLTLKIHKMYFIKLKPVSQMVKYVIFSFFSVSLPFQTNSKTQSAVSKWQNAHNYIPPDLLQFHMSNLLHQVFLTTFCQLCHKRRQKKQ